MNKKQLDVEIEKMKDQILQKIKKFEKKHDHNFTGMIFIPQQVVTHYSKTTWNMTSYGWSNYE